MADSPGQIDYAAAIAACATTAGWERNYPLLQQAGGAALEALLPAALDAEMRVRMWSIELLGKIADVESLAAVVKALSDPIADVRRHAVLAVGSLIEKQPNFLAEGAQALLKVIASDRSLVVRRLAGFVLGNQPAYAPVGDALHAAHRQARDEKLRRILWRAIGVHTMSTADYR